MTRRAVSIVASAGIFLGAAVASAQTPPPSGAEPMPGPAAPTEAKKETAAQAAGMNTTNLKSGGVAGTGLGGKNSDPIKGTMGTGQSVPGPAGSALSKGMTSSPGGEGGPEVGDKKLPPPNP